MRRVYRNAKRPAFCERQFERVQVGRSHVHVAAQFRHTRHVHVAEAVLQEQTYEYSTAVYAYTYILVINILLGNSNGNLSAILVVLFSCESAVLLNPVVRAEVLSAVAAVITCESSRSLLVQYTNRAKNHWRSLRKSFSTLREVLAITGHTFTPRAIDQLLLRQAHELLVLEEVRALDDTCAAERPARAADRLIYESTYVHEKTCYTVQGTLYRVYTRAQPLHY